jgi:hypothetical protein
MEEALSANGIAQARKIFRPKGLMTNAIYVLPSAGVSV